MHLYRDIYRRAVQGKCNRPIRCSCSLKNLSAYAYVFTKRLKRSATVRSSSRSQIDFPNFSPDKGEKKKKEKKENVSKIGKKHGGRGTRDAWRSIRFRNGRGRGGGKNIRAKYLKWKSRSTRWQVNRHEVEWQMKSDTALSRGGRARGGREGA